VAIGYHDWVLVVVEDGCFKKETKKKRGAAVSEIGGGNVIFIFDSSNSKRMLSGTGIY
jgi:hypothetical protein